MSADNGSFKVGQKICLISTSHSPKAYKDQFGFEHPAWILNNCEVVTVLEQRIVKGIYSKNDFFGYKAKNHDGSKEFDCNWESCDDSSRDCYSSWTNSNFKDLDDYHYYEIIRTRSLFPLVDNKGKEWIPPEPVKVCRKHTTVMIPEYYYDHCFWCKNNVP